MTASRMLYCRDELSSQIAALPHCKRRTLRDMAIELGVSKTTIHRMLRSESNEGGGRYLVSHTNLLHPLLTEEHKVARVAYAVSKLDLLQRGCFSSFIQDVHVDEKWFEVSSNRVRVYLTSNEKENHQVPV